MDDLLNGARKVVAGLGKQVGFSSGGAGFRFFKVRIGGSVKGRMIVFVVSGGGKVVPLLIRLKKDKKMGMNMSANNPNVVAQVEKNLDRVLEDVEGGKFREFEF